LLKLPKHSQLNTALLVALVTNTAVVAFAETESHLNLTYDKPATKWTEALPVGNGRIGAMVFGGT